MVRVLFVCLGNICRSPMADAVFQHLVEEVGLSAEIRVDSAGTGSWHVGEQAHRGTRRVLAQHGISYNGRARQVAPGDLAQFDYVLAMDYDNLSTLQAMARGRSDVGHIGLFMDYAPGAGTREVPDPYYDNRFEEVYNLVRQAAEGLLHHIREAHNL